MAALSFTVLANRNFRFLLLARLLVVACLSAQAVIIGWQIYERTKDPLMLGLSGLAEALPAVSCALFAGYIVDHSKPRTVLLMCFSALLVNTFFLFLVGSGLLHLETTAFLICAYSAIFFSGLARSFIMPASFSLLAQVVDRKDMPAASGWASTGFQTALVLSPALAGFVYAGFGALYAWLMPMCFIFGAWVCMFFVHPPQSYTPPLKREPAIQSIREGWQFLRNTPVLLGAMSIDMVAVLFGGVMAILPAFALDVLHIGAEGFGLLRASPSIGAVGMALFLAVRPLKIIRFKTLLWVVAGFGVSVIGFGLSSNLFLACLFLGLSGVFDSVSVVIRGVLVQLLTPEHMRGRVSSVNSMFIISSNELGAFQSGVFAKLMGLVPSILFGGGISLLVAGFVATKKSIRDVVVNPSDHP